MEATLNKFHAVIRALVASSKLTIACVRRHCLAGGAELALVCDIVYAGSDAIFGFPEIKLAAFPPVAMVALSAVVGQKRAAELLFTARSITAQEALAMGLINETADDPETLVAECLQRVSQLSPAALRIAKKAFYGWDAMHFEKGLMRAEEIYREHVTPQRGRQGGHSRIHRKTPPEVDRQVSRHARASIAASGRLSRVAENAAPGVARGPSSSWDRDFFIYSGLATGEISVSYQHVHDTSMK